MLLPTPSPSIFFTNYQKEEDKNTV
jgi:hypothetical protein